MLIEKISLKNFRRYEQLDITFNNQLTVLVGINGSGKTTVLDAVAKSLYVFMNKFFTQIKYPNRISRSDLRVHTVMRGQMFDAIEMDSAKIAAFGTYNNEKYEDFIIFNVKNISKSAEIGIKLFDDYNSGKDVTLPIICFYGAGRLWNDNGANDLSKTPLSRLNGYRGCWNAHLSTKEMNSWFEQMTYLKIQRNEKIAILDAVYYAIGKAFIFVTECKEFEISMNIILHELEISYQEKNGDATKLFLSQLSDGYRCTISLIADIAYRMATLNPQLDEKVIEKTDGVVLIDEIDLHLHPEWQQKILDVLTKVFPKVQFIVTTHAPAVINSVEKRESLIILEDDKVVSSPVEPYGRDVNTIISTVMHADERPKSVKELFSDFENCLNEKDYENAHKIIDKLENKLVTDDEELAACKVRLDFEEMLENEE